MIRYRTVLQQIFLAGLYRNIFHASHGLCYEDCGLLKLLALHLRERHHPDPTLSIRLTHHLHTPQT